MKRFCILSFLVSFFYYSYGQKIEWALEDVKGDSPFYDGIAKFRINENGFWYGAIDRTGKVVIEPQFKDISNFEDGFAIVETKDGYSGIINRRGDYILEPVYKSISKGYGVTISGLYEVKNEEGKYGLFYNNRLILPVIYERISLDKFPFIDVRNTGGKSFYINLIDGKTFEIVSKFGDIFWTHNSNNNVIENKYYTKEGIELDVSGLSVSSKGITLFEKDKKYGFRNVNTGDTVVSAIYNKPTVPFFINDIMIVFKGVSKEWQCGLVNAYGKEVIKSGLFDFIQPLNEKFDIFLVMTSDAKLGFYSASGKELLPAKYSGYDTLNDEWIIAEKDLYNYSTGKLVSDIMFATLKDDMICVAKEVNGKTKKGYINSKTLKEIPFKYDEANDFSDDIARVRIGNESFFIDKNDKIVLRGENFPLYSFGNANEGVIPVYIGGGTRGYIYNPVKKSEYVYNQTTSVSDATIDRWLQEGHENFGKKKYAIAKEYYYKAMMASPTNVNAIISYGACLANMGYYQESIESYNMALDIEPNNKTALNNIAISQQNVKVMQEQTNNNRSSTFWDALSTFGTVLYNAGNAYNGNGANNSFSQGFYSNDAGNSSSTDCASYQRRYNEMKTKRDNEAKNNAGREGTVAGKNAVHQIKTKYGNDPDITGGATSGDYRVINSSKALIREYERQMESIARQARQAGCSVY